MRHLSGYRGEAHGEVYETMVVSELIKWMKTVQKDAEVFFYRTRSGLEVDLLLKTKDGIIGMETKSRREVSLKDINPMKEVALKLKEEWKGGVLVYQGDEIKKLTEPHIWAVPSRRLFI